MEDGLNILYARRSHLFATLRLQLQALSAVDDDVANFMLNLEFFATTTELGRDFVTLLLFPPTRCRVTGHTLDNNTGDEMRRFLERARTSVVELLPFLHTRRSTTFPICAMCVKR